jgi:hypothetical protein
MHSSELSREKKDKYNATQRRKRAARADSTAPRTCKERRQKRDRARTNKSRRRAQRAAESSTARALRLSQKAARERARRAARSPAQRLLNNDGERKRYRRRVAARKKETRARTRFGRDTPRLPSHVAQRDARNRAARERGIMHVEHGCRICLPTHDAASAET